MITYVVPFISYCFYNWFIRFVLMGDYEYTTMKVRKEIAGWLEEFLELNDDYFKSVNVTSRSALMNWILMEVLFNAGVVPRPAAPVIKIGKPEG